MRTTQQAPRVGSSLSTAVSWVMVNTKTRSKKSSRVETRSTRSACSRGWATVRSRPPPGGGRRRRPCAAPRGRPRSGRRRPGRTGEGPVGAVALAQVGRQPGGPGGAGVALGQQGAADPGVVHQGRPVHAVDGDRALHVAELAHVVVALGNRRPAEQRVADRLQGLLVLDHPLALVGVPGRVAVHEAGHARPPGLLELEEHDVAGVVALEQGDVGAQPDAADPDHLVGQVDDLVVGEHAPPVRRQGVQVGLQALDQPARLPLGHVGDQRLVDDVAGAARSRVSLGRARSLVRVRARWAARSISPRSDQSASSARIRSMSSRSKDRAAAAGRPGTQLAPVGVGAAQHRVLAGVLREAVLAAGHPHAGRQPVQVPLPGPGVGLVEVVEVEDQVALGRGVEAEVAQVGVAADDRLDPGPGQVGEVLGHQRGRAAQERVRRGRHPPDPHRDQPLQPALVGLLDQVQRVGPVLGRPPAPEGAPPDLLAQGPPGLAALLAGR